MTAPSRVRPFVLSLALTLAACGTDDAAFPFPLLDGGGSTDGGGSGDAASDAGGDANTEDAGGDTTTDTQRDADPDGGEDAANDAAADTPVDAPDSAGDTSSDATDTTTDVARDTSTDTSPDIAADATPDTTTDTASDADTDPATDTTTDTRPGDADGDTTPSDPCDATNGNLGCAFWAVDLPNLEGGDTAGFGVEISNPEASPANVTIVLPDDTRRDLLVASGATELVDLGDNGIASSDTFERAFRITSDSPVIVTQLNPTTGAEFTADGTMLWPDNAAGRSFVAASWPTRDLGSAIAHGFVAVVGVGPGTTNVDVTVSADTLLGLDQRVSAGTRRTFSVDAGSILYLRGAGDGDDLTGTTIAATGEIAVFAGHACANVPQTVSYCDHLEEQLRPTTALGSQYVLPAYVQRGTEPSAFRVVAVEPDTRVTTSPEIGDGAFTLGAGEHRDLLSARDVTLQATGPVLVVQSPVSTEYPAGTCLRDLGLGCDVPIEPRCDVGALGDPSTLLTTPISRFARVHELTTPAGYLDHHVTIVAPTGIRPVFDGAPVSVTPSTVGDWDIYRLTPRPGPHQVVATEPVGVSVYGYGCGVSYAYATGGSGRR